MKKICVILGMLLMCFVMLSCSKQNESHEGTNVSNASKEDTNKENDASEEDNTYLILNVTINPEFQIILDMNYMITEIIPYNDDASSLFSELDVTGISYEKGMMSILDKAYEMKFISSEKTDIVIVPQMNDDIAKPVYEELNDIIESPIQDFNVDKGTKIEANIMESVPIDVEDLDEEELTTLDENNKQQIANTTEVMDIVDSTTKKVIGQSTYTYDENGDLLKEEFETFSIKTEIYEYKNGVKCRWYLETTAGGITEEHYDASGSRVSRHEEYSNGNTYDYTYHSHEIIKERIICENGDYYHELYSEDGTPIEVEEIKAEGSSYKILYYENGMMKSHVADYVDGTHVESYYSEDGTQTKYIEKHADGTYIEHDDNGNTQIDIPGGDEEDRLNAAAGL